MQTKTVAPHLSQIAFISGLVVTGLTSSSQLQQALGAAGSIKHMQKLGKPEHVSELTQGIDKLIADLKGSQHDKALVTTLKTELIEVTNIVMQHNTNGAAGDHKHGSPQHQQR